MSCTSLYELFKTKANCIAELQNGSGSGPAIWDYTSIKVLGKKFDMFNDKEFWPSYKSDKLDDEEKAVLLATYDNAFIEVDHLMAFSEACKKVHALIIDTTDWGWSHFEAIGEAAAELYKDHDHRCKGMAIGCTSVCDLWEQEAIKNIDSWGVYEQLATMESVGHAG